MAVVRQSAGGAAKRSAARQSAGGTVAKRGAGRGGFAVPPFADGMVAFAAGRNSREQVAEIQRARLLAGAVAAVEEVGYEAATVAQITVRARVSRRTFYELFENREECLAAVLQDTVKAVERELWAAGVAGLPWREQIRVGLWMILAFLDLEPALARTCVVGAARGGGPIQQCREAVLDRLAEVVDQGRAGSPVAGVSALTAEGLVGAGFAVVHSRLTRGRRKPLTDSYGELLGMILLPYIGTAAARRAQARPLPARPGGWARRGVVRRRRLADPLEGVQMRMTYRTARVLEVAAQRPGGSNREIADLAGISDQGQVSKLLARLERLGLIVNSGMGHTKGEPNRWTLTARGERVARGMRLGSDPATLRAAGKGE